MSSPKPSRAERLFLELLSSALNRRAVDGSLFVRLPRKLWLQIITIAHKQCVPALVGEVILSLPKEALPERQLYLKLALIVEATKASNQHQRHCLHRLRASYEAEGLPFVLLKGQSLALYYPESDLRAVGDIDVYLYRPGDYERANAWAQRQGYPLIGMALYEQPYRMEDMIIENHLYITYFGRKKYDSYFSRIMDEVIHHDAFERIKIDGQTYLSLPRELNAVYIFQHILHHFAYLGIAFRQVCDWIYYLQRHREQMDVELFGRYAQELDLMRPMQIFALMAVKYLGIEAKIFPFGLSQEDHLADVVLREIFDGGNFGFEAFRGKSFHNIWQRRWYMFHRTVIRSLRVSPISPEHIRNIGWIAILTRLKLLFR